MRVLVTGGTGFLGHHVTEVLREQKLEAIPVGTVDANFDSHLETLKLFQKYRPEGVIHLAAMVGGIGANQKRPAEFWRYNTSFGLNVLDACIATGVKRIIIVGTTCSYPKVPKTIPFIEEELFDGYPEPTNAPYGIAKRSLIVGALAYRQQFGLDCVCVVPTNLYGPRDNFDEKSSHVIPALLRKMHTATVLKERSVTVWGSGKATRDFLYVKDAAAGIVAALERGSSGDILNLGSGSEVSIRNLIEQISEVTKFKGMIKFDSSQPDGQPRRALDSSKAHHSLGWKPKMSLFEGLILTYDWWRSKSG